jgi:hypothetical protein
MHIFLQDLARLKLIARFLVLLGYNENIKTKRKIVVYGVMTRKSLNFHSINF